MLLTRCPASIDLISGNIDSLGLAIDRQLDDVVAISISKIDHHPSVICYELFSSANRQEDIVIDRTGAFVNKRRLNTHGILLPFSGNAHCRP